MKIRLRYYIIFQVIALFTFIISLTYQGYNVAFASYTCIILVSIGYMYASKDIRKEVNNNG